MPKRILDFFSWLSGRASSVFFTGLLTVLPIVVTAAVIGFFYSTFHKYFSFLSVPIIVLVLMLVGILAEYIIIQAIINPIERLIDKIPFIGAFYSGIRSMANFFTHKRSDGTRRQVVLVQYPRKGTYHLALLIGPADNDFAKVIPEASQKPMVRVFMPTTHFTMGYFLIVPKDEVIETDIKFSEAVRSIVSGGLITPESINDLPQPSKQTKIDEK